MMLRVALGFVRFVLVACVYGLACLPLSETAAVPSSSLRRRAEVPPSVFEVPPNVRNVFPAANFNRDVTTNWWETELLDGHASKAASELAASLKNASFVILDQEFYQVSFQTISPCSTRNSNHLPDALES